MQIWNGSNKYCWRYRADTILSTDGQMDKVKPVYPRFNFVEAGGIIMTGILLISQYKNLNNWLFNGIVYMTILLTNILQRYLSPWQFHVMSPDFLLSRIVRLCDDFSSPKHFTFVSITLAPILLPWLYSKTQISNVSWLYWSYHIERLVQSFALRCWYIFPFTYYVLFLLWNLLVLGHLQIKKRRTFKNCV